MLVIHPDECIDCGVCEPECPADAIKADTEDGLEKWLEVNTKFADIWPNITMRKDAHWPMPMIGCKRPINLPNIFRKTQARVTDRRFSATNLGKQVFCDIVEKI